MDEEVSPLEITIAYVSKSAALFPHFCHTAATLSISGIP